MLEFIKIIVIAIFSGVLMPLPVSSSAHFALLNDILGFSSNENVLAFYTAVFSLCFALVLIFSLRKIYISVIKALFIFNKETLEDKHLSTYKRLALNLFLSLIPVGILFIPISQEKLLIDYFASFSLPSNLILVAIASVFLGLIMLICSWYNKSVNSKTHKLSKTGDSVRLSIYQIPCYIIPGLSQVACGVAKLTIRDINSKTVMREVYTYIAPQMLVISIVQLVRISTWEVSIYPLTAIIGAIVFFAICSVVVALISKFNIKKLFVFCAIYSIVLGIYAALTAFFI